MRTSITTISLLLLLSCNFNNKITKELNTLLSEEVNENNPGILFSLYSNKKNDNLNLANGYSNKETKETLDPKNVFRIASVTKTFVAVAILRLYEENKLKLEDRIVNYISPKHNDYLQSGGYNTTAITIKHLLTHTSGMADHTNSPKYSLDYFKKKIKATRTTHIQDLIDYTKPIGDIGEKYQYSDTGYVILGEILENITQLSMGEAIKKLVNFKKIGLTHTYMESYDGDTSKNRIHQYLKGVDTYDFHPSFDYYGGGGLLSTTQDLAKFYYSLFHNKIFKHKTTLTTMLAPVEFADKQTSDCRMGIFKNTIAGIDCYEHRGFWGTQVVYFPKLDLTMAANYSQKWTNKGPAPIFKKVLKVLSKN